MLVQGRALQNLYPPSCLGKSFQTTAQKRNKMMGLTGVSPFPCNNKCIPNLHRNLEWKGPVGISIQRQGQRSRKTNH